jgi:isopentenyl-diphosphate delta-isomerase
MTLDGNLFASELVDLVDSDDRVVGSSSIADCIAKGFLHRAVAVLVRRSSGAMLLQLRSKKKKWDPGLWTLSSTGHVKRGEAYDAAARRELEEELGLRTNLIPQGKILIPPISVGSMTEYEWVALYSAVSDAQVSMDPAELDAVREVSIDEAKGMIARNELTADAVILLEHFLEVHTAGH